MSFYHSQLEEQKDMYIDLLKVMGSLSHLFSDSKSPYIYYRAMENVFCQAFNAENLSRSDISADASKNGIGIGLKTFLHGNGKTFQKVAEFNKDSLNINILKDEELVYSLSEMRNDRITTTQRISNCNSMIYHLLTRSNNAMSLYEEEMELVDINSIKNISSKGNSIYFSDKRNDYNFNKSKSTLYKRFITNKKNEIKTFKVNILDNPFDFLLGLNTQEELKVLKSDNKDIVDYIVLPLYSPKDNKVHEHSGLNQWNADGRDRNPNEAYIPIPLWIHKSKNNFFDYKPLDFKTESFNVLLPNGKELSMKVTQQGGKALMSNPNKALGKWLLRDVLNLPERVLLTKSKLDDIGIDSVKLSKTKDNKYYLDFVKSGSYEEFKQEYK